MPPAAREALGLTWSERVLAWASVDVDPGADTGPEADTGPGSAGGVAAVWAATLTGLRAGGAEELPWDAIAEMSWEPPQLRVRPLRGEEMVVRLRAGSDLAAQVRARVEASIVHSRRAPLLADGRGVLVVARRVGPDRRVAWAMVFDPGVDSGNPVLRERAMTFLARVRAETGL
ncbi:MAG: hypothetical protein ACXVHC_02930 [Frankiaceae bacterium]